MIQLHQSDWIMISMWLASASRFLSLPAIFLLSPLLLPLCLSTVSFLLYIAVKILHSSVFFFGGGGSLLSYMYGATRGSPAFQFCVKSVKKKEGHSILLFYI